MATVKPVYLNTTSGRLTVIQSGDTIDSSVLPTSSGGGVTVARVATTASLTLSAPGSTIDGVTMVSGDLVLVKDQSTASQNGVYVWNGAASAMTRASVMDTSGETLTGTLIGVSEGTINQTSLWQLATFAPITLNTTGLSFVQINSGNTMAVSTDVTVDFGSTPTYAKQFTVTIPGLQTNQRVQCYPSGYTPSGVYFDEHEFGVLMWVGKVTAADTLLLLGSSTSPISGERIVQVNAHVSTSTMFVTSGTSVTPDYLIQGSNIS